MDQHRTYRLGDVARAVGLPKATLSAWLARKHIALTAEKGDRDTTGMGDHRQFSWFRIINIAIVAELNRLGIPPSADTSRFALHFSDLGGAKKGHMLGNEPAEIRQPGGLFDTGGTWFVVRNVDGALSATVVSAIDEFVMRVGREFASSAIIIDMCALARRVQERLTEGTDD